MKNSELRALSVEELEKKLVVEKENLEKLIFSHAATPIENPMRIKVARRFVARIPFFQQLSLENQLELCRVMKQEKHSRKTQRIHMYTLCLCNQQKRQRC